MNRNLAKDKLILLGLFGIVQLFLLLYVGIYTKEEAIKYISEASYFSQHHYFSQPKYFFYSAYIVLHIISNSLGSGFIVVYLFQLIANAAALICLYSLVLNLRLPKSVAFLTCVLLILCLPFQKWTVYLFTESLFFSLIIIYTSILFNRDLSVIKKILFALPIFFLIVISRPTGLLFIPCSLTLLSVTLFRKRKFVLLTTLWLAGLGGFIWLANVIMRGQGEFDFMKPLVEEHIICGYKTAGISYAGAPNESNSIQSLFAYISDNLGQFTRLALKRAIAFFGLIRPYFSLRHNLYLGIYFYPIYLFSLIGIRFVYQRSKRFVLYSTLLVATFLLSVLLTCDDWHNRFIMPAVPIIMIYASAGIQFLYERLIRSRNVN